MREIRLLTETSTQIRVSVDPKAPLSAQPKGEQTIITGTLLFGKYFLHRDFRSAPVTEPGQAEET